MRFMRKAGAPAEKSAKRLYVDPAELARKLVKEMDDHMVSRGDRLWVRNRYTIYLCPEDYDKLAPRGTQVIAELSAKLAKHVHDMEYLRPGRPRAWRWCSTRIWSWATSASSPRGSYPAAARRGRLAAQQAPAAAGPAAGRCRRVASPCRGSDARLPRPQRRRRGRFASTRPQRTEDPGHTPRSCPPKQAEELGLARRVIVITSGDKVTRVHARAAWSSGREQGSRPPDQRPQRLPQARGHLLERRPAHGRGPGLHQRDHGERLSGHEHRVAPQDVVAIGESRLTVEGK